MTKLEKIIYDAVESELSKRGMMISSFDKKALSEAVAAAVLPLIEDAFDAGGDRATFHGRPGIEDALTKSEWLSENLQINIFSPFPFLDILNRCGKMVNTHSKTSQRKQNEDSRRDIK